MMGKITKRFDTIAYVRPTEKCNLRCEHCFIPPNPATMSDKQILDIPRQLSDAGTPRDISNT
jgi:MoaA/NifB/PqqE/SkfB family radical SAM enzyme